ncbi:serine hydrolase [Steroidobacter flavus]|uniref:D-alanyl-D-alanine dipeptidase n=1 Tax=Steroidobacter flavus TaxID=1842136 RepID=A0ABV8SXB0_9GAMM
MWRSVVMAVALMPAIATAASTNIDGVWQRAGEAALVAAEQERAARNIPSIAVGIVTRDGLVWSGGVGHADAEGKQPLDGNTVYRIGGLTQAFTAELVRSLAASGKLDLDAPVTRYLPSFQPRNTFGGEITVRHLLEHRSGLVRMPPRGHHADLESATLAETVTSLNATALMSQPGSAVKYSDAGYAVLAHVAEVAGGKPFEKLLAETVLTPRSMTQTSLRADKSSLAVATMAPFDGERFAPAVFDTGVVASLGAQSSTKDLARFTQDLFGREAPTLSGERGVLDRHDVVSLSGATYGYTTDLSVFPADGFAVITLMAIDSAQPVLKRLRDFTARQVIAAKTKQRRPASELSTKVPVGTAHRLQGHYSDGAHSLDIRIVDQRLFVEAPGLAAELRQRGSRLVVDDLAVSGDELQSDSKARSVTFRGVTYQRTNWERPAEPTADLAGFVGEYGWPHNILRVYERDGDVYARVEWSQHYKLEKAGKDAYRFPAAGLYANEELRFTRDERGIGAAANLSGVVMPHRDLGAETEIRSRANAPFIAALVANARKMSPPAQPANLRKPDLVEVNKLEPTTKLDVRYATTENFMGAPFYDSPRFFMQRPAASGLIRAHRKLAEQGFGIVLIDGYRPWYATRMFWDAVPPESRPFVADPSQGSRHNRGCAADISMFELATGKTVEMAGRYDEPSARSSPLYVGGTSLQRWRRDLLKNAMEAEGFDVYVNEWWHFDYGEWRNYPVMNVDFNEIGGGS